MTAPGSRTSDYDFDLPASHIAQRPLAVRDASRLMVVDRAAGTIAHRVFADLAEMILAGDVLAANRSRVIPVRLLGSRASGAPAEILLLRPHGQIDAADASEWEAMVSPGGKLKPGRRVVIGDDLTVEILGVTDRRTRVVRLHTPLGFARALEQYGHVPLPPYIDRLDDTADVERYQTVYAHEPGSAAAPTAGLHFTHALLARLETRGVRRAEIVLHVGAGTFKPVEASDPADHVMHEEFVRVTDDAATTINAAHDAGHAVWAVGTTSARALESSIGADGCVAPFEGETRLFIRPGHRFRAVDRLVTNFHLPRSTLLMLVAAFAGYDLTMRAYAEAIRLGYRFYSYGDAMVIV